MADEDRMETEEEEEEEDDEDDGQGVNMMNFMFGNVDSHGELEGDFLDEVCVSLSLVLTLLVQQNMKPQHRDAVQEAKQSLGGLQNARAGLDMSVSSPVACSLVSRYMATQKKRLQVAFRTWLRIDPQAKPRHHRQLPAKASSS